MSILSDTYQRQKAQAKGFQVNVAAVCVFLSVMLVAQSLYYDIRSQNNYAASARLHGTLDSLVQQERKDAEQLDYLIGELGAFMAKAKQIGAEYGF